MRAQFEWNGCNRKKRTTVPWNDFAGTTRNGFEETAAPQPLPHRSRRNDGPHDAVTKTAFNGAFRSTSFTKGPQWNDQPQMRARCGARAAITHVP
jgi:hypothetical protein